VSRQLLRQARSWVEASQSYEKNRLGLSQIFLNSLRLTWVFGLLSDTVLLLRARALLSRPPTTELLQELSRPRNEPWEKIAKYPQFSACRKTNSLTPSNGDIIKESRHGS
jgi:hypothetical protein